MMESVRLQQAGARWFHTADWEGPNLSKASLGNFFFAVLSQGAQVGDIWVMNPKFHKSAIMVSVFMTEEMKAAIEASIKVKFKYPPKMQLNS